MQIHVLSPKCNAYNQIIFCFFRLSGFYFPNSMVSGLYLGYKTLKIFACGGRVPGYGFAGDAIDRVNHF